LVGAICKIAITKIPKPTLGPDFSLEGELVRGRGARGHTIPRRARALNRLCNN